MTTGATGQLGLALPVQGELSGTWGDTVNNGITQYTNIAIAGTLTLTGDGAVTLANTTGDASASNITSTLAGAGTVTAQFAIVQVSGTTTTKVVTGPSYSKTYVVDNASSYAVTFKASGQTGVSVAAAEKVTVVFNGTDYIKLAGTIANAAGSNTQIQFNNGGLFGASANLTWDGTTLSSTQVNITGQGTLRLQDTTGGEYVGLRSPSALGASYTLTFPADDGTNGQALITDGSGVLSWSTAASGDVYGPGSSTDNAVARFDSTTGKLLQNSVVIIGDTGDVSGVGTLSATTLTLTNALGTAYGGTGLTSFTSGGVVYASSTSALATSSALTFDGANLGLGTASPTYKLNVVAGAGSQNIFQAGQSGVSNGYTISSDGTNLTYQWYPTGSEGMRLTSTGLGIGTSSIPSGFKLYASGGSMLLDNNTAFRQKDSAGNNTLIFALSSGNNLEFGSSQHTGGMAIVTGNSNITFTTNSAERMRLDSAGNLGLGVTPSAWSAIKAMQFAGGVYLGSFTASATPNLYLGTNNYFNGSDFIYSGSYAASRYDQSAGVHKWFTAPSGTAGYAISFTQAMTLNASGNLMLGTTGSSGRLTVVGGLSQLSINAAGTQQVLQLNNSDTTAGVQAVKLGFSSSGVTKASINCAVYGNDYMAFNVGSDTERARIDSSGTLSLRDAPASNALQFGTTSGGIYSEAARLGLASGALTFFVGSTVNESARIDSSGNLGIGTASPGNLLSVLSASTTATVAKFAATNYGNLGTTYIEIGTQNGDGGSRIGSINPTGNQSILVFETMTASSGTYAERARIDNNGNLLVGASSAFDGSYRGIQAINTAGGDCAVFTTTGVSGTVVRWNKATSGDNLFIDFYTETSITARGGISYNRAGGLTAYNTTSDYRAKDISGPVTNSGALIDSVPVYMGKMKGATQERPMFIAHETPNYAHTGVKDAIDADGNPVYQQMDASALIPVMWAEIQSLRQRVAQLETN